MVFIRINWTLFNCFLDTVRIYNICKIHILHYLKTKTMKSLLFFLIFSIFCNAQDYLSPIDFSYSIDSQNPDSKKLTIKFLPKTNQKQILLDAFNFELNGDMNFDSDDELLITGLEINGSEIKLYIPENSKKYQTKDYEKLQKILNDKKKKDRLIKKILKLYENFYWDDYLSLGNKVINKKPLSISNIILNEAKFSPEIIIGSFLRKHLFNYYGERWFPESQINSSSSDRYIAKKPNNYFNDSDWSQEGLDKIKNEGFLMPNEVELYVKNDVDEEKFPYIVHLFKYNYSELEMVNRGAIWENGLIAYKKPYKTSKGQFNILKEEKILASWASNKKLTSYNDRYNAIMLRAAAFWNNDATSVSTNKIVKGNVYRHSGETKSFEQYLSQKYLQSELAVFSRKMIEAERPLYETYLTTAFIPNTYKGYDLLYGRKRLGKNLSNTICYLDVVNDAYSDFFGIPYDDENCTIVPVCFIKNKVGIPFLGIETEQKFFEFNYNK